MTAAAPTAAPGASSGTPVWDTAQLDAARQVGDPEVDALAHRVLAEHRPLPGDTRLGYNHLLDLADRLLEEPELYLVRGSGLRQQLDGLDPELTGFFDPQPVPAWVDEDLLAQAGTLWNAHGLAIICVLYALSLPSCYLIGRGVPALYATRKLGTHRFISQRIYETGLMLDAAMRADGMRLVTDVPAGALAEELLRECVQRQPYAGWAWRGDHLGPQPGSAAIDRAGVAVMVRATHATRPRYAWGAGVVSARKVRFLHASMRYYLLHPLPPLEGEPATSGEALAHASGPAWDASNGVPVNQEDLAYTLLTFGYLIPQGLARWGIVFTPAECEAFWHRWRFIGHLMGVQEALLPRTVSEARVLHDRILARQRAATAMAGTLTQELLHFFGDYLPPRFRLAVPALMIRSQLGPDAELLLGATRPPAWMDVVYRLVLLPALRVVGFMRRSVGRFLPLGTAWLDRIGHEASTALIDSWRDGYDRRPFYIPDSAAGGWRRSHGVDAAYLAQVEHWRSQLFWSCAIGVGLLIAGVLLLLVSLPLWLLLPLLALIVDQFAGLAIGLGVVVLAMIVPHLASRRPRRSSTGGIYHPLHALRRTSPRC